MIPIKSIAIAVLSFIWLGRSIIQWLIEYPDLNKLTFAVGFFLVGMYVAYDQWYKKNVEDCLNDLRNDIMSVDRKCNSNENHIIALKK